MNLNADVLAVESVAKRFGGVQALGGVTLQVRRGEFHAIIGPNGAGKSTFFNTLTGLITPDAGSVRFEGRDLAGLAPHQRVRLGMGRTFQITRVFPDLTLLENVQVALLAHDRLTLAPWRAASGHRPADARALLERVGLQVPDHQPASTLAHGDRKRLELAITLAGEPRLLLLDEPTAGMAAQERLESIRMVHKVASELGLSCLFTEHDMAVVFSVASRISVLVQGKLLITGQPEEVRASEQVQRVYLGEAVIEQGAG
ncbi:MAG: ABC transporter ATP-binding protein [Betaproteobacteria bacterium]|nr:ABC transporter ATP-binding protein [Betaproteobacteria bacterium]